MRHDLLRDHDPEAGGDPLAQSDQYRCALPNEAMLSDKARRLRHGLRRRRPYSNSPRHKGFAVKVVITSRNATIKAFWLARGTSPVTTLGDRLPIISIGLPASPASQLIQFGCSKTATAYSRAARSSLAMSNLRILRLAQRADKRNFSH
ncbi:hypothetical protein ACFQY9_27050 [Microvirga aerilata]|uniref:hypothetical protein n=1 Tax=Microvirga aerilata TaxID=670292 RepID=UPI00362BE4A4